MWSMTDWNSQFWVIFYCCTPLKTPKIRILKKQTKLLEISSFYKYVLKIMIIWCKILEIQSENRVRQTEFFVILGHFLSFYPSNDPEIQNFEKMKKALGDIILLHVCTIIDNHMMYGSWDTEHNRQIFVILGHFLVFYPTTNLKNQILEKNKKVPGDMRFLWYDTWWI